MAIQAPEEMPEILIPSGSMLSSSENYICPLKHTQFTICSKSSKSGLYLPFNSQGHTGTGPQHLPLVGVEPTTEGTTYD